MALGKQLKGLNQVRILPFALGRIDSRNMTLALIIEGVMNNGEPQNNSINKMKHKQIRLILTLLENMKLINFKFPISHCIERLEDYLTISKKA